MLLEDFTGSLGVAHLRQKQTDRVAVRIPGIHRNPTQGPSERIDNPLAILKADIGNWRTKVPETRTRAIAPFVKLSKGLRAFARRLGLVGVSRNLDIARSFCATGYGNKERQGEE